MNNTISVKEKYNFKNIQKVVLGIMCFEGSEHLYNTIKELDPYIDHVILAYQDISYHDDPISKNELEIIKDVASELNCELLKTKLNPQLQPREQEAEKRNIIMKYAEDLGYSHIIIIDADEYYNGISFLNALKKIDENNYDLTYCQYINYYKDYMHYLVYPFKDGMYVPFIARTSYRHSYNCTDITLPSDPTRRYIRKKNSTHYLDSLYVFKWEEIKMHHFSWIRNNINGKVKSWSAKKTFENVSDLIDRALNDFNNFNDDYKRVHLIFNTPDNCVDVGKFPKQYVKIHREPSFYKKEKEEKRILVLNMSGNTTLYKELENCCRETWAYSILNKEVNGVSYYSVHSTYDETCIDKTNNRIFIKQPRNVKDIDCLLHRFKYAIEFLEKEGIKFDYIVKTNTSTYLNIPLIKELLDNESDDSKVFGIKMQGAFWSTYNPYIQGNLTIFSTRIIHTLLDMNNVKSSLIADGLYDDVVLGSNLFYRFNFLGINPFSCIKTIKGLYDRGVDENIKEIFNLNSIYAVQIKTPLDYKDNSKYQINLTSDEFRIKYDIEKMKKWHNKFSLCKDDVLEPVVNNKISTQICELTKSEYQKLKAEDASNFWYFSESKDFETFNEFMLYLNTLKKNGGYSTY